jgi:hypothetical protein
LLCPGKWFISIFSTLTFIHPHHSLENRIVIEWILTDPLPRYYAEYAQYTLASDEHFFSTLVMNSPFCDLPRLASTLVFVIFDRWEHQKPLIERDDRKCLAIDPMSCGRSPVTIQPDLLPYLLASNAMFARKFDPDDVKSMDVVNTLDKVRSNASSVMYQSKRVQIILDTSKKESISNDSANNHEDTGGSTWCLEFQPKSKYVKMNNCIENSFTQTGDEDMTTASGKAVTRTMTFHDQQFELSKNFHFVFVECRM